MLWDGREHLLVWEEDPEGDSKIFGVSIFSEDYITPFSESRQISDLDGTDPSLPAASSMNGHTLVVWQEKGLDGYWQIFGQSLVRK